MKIKSEHREKNKQHTHIAIEMTPAAVAAVYISEARVMHLGEGEY
jgi:hypothetical protein